MEKNTPRKLRMGKISQPYRLCTSLWGKAKGLMFKSKVDQPLVFVFSKEKRHGLHMLFVFCSIDVLFLDKNKRVVEMKQNFEPFAFYTPKRPCQYIIEMAADSIKKSKTGIGDRISF